MKTASAALLFVFILFSNTLAFASGLIDAMEGVYSTPYQGSDKNDAEYTTTDDMIIAKISGSQAYFLLHVNGFNHGACILEGTAEVKGDKLVHTVSEENGDGTKNVCAFSISLDKNDFYFADESPSNDKNIGCRIYCGMNAGLPDKGFSLADRQSKKELKKIKAGERYRSILNSIQKSPASENVIDEMEGVYKHRFKNKMIENNTEQDVNSENELDIAKIDTDHAYISIALWGYNGSYCGVSGTAIKVNDGLLYQESSGAGPDDIKGKCAFSLIKEGDTVTAEEKGYGSCDAYCGANSHIGGSQFLISQKLMGKDLEIVKGSDAYKSEKTKIENLHRNNFLDTNKVFPAENIIGKMEGVYKDRFKNALTTGEQYSSEDILEIARVNENTAYIRYKLEFYNGHSCALSGIAEEEGDHLLYEETPATAMLGDDDICILSLSIKDGAITTEQLSHPKSGVGGCNNYCGARGHFDNVKFKLSTKRKIRYMKKLTNSVQYKEALEKYRRNLEYKKEKQKIEKK